MRVLVGTAYPTRIYVRRVKQAGFGAQPMDCNDIHLIASGCVKAEVRGCD